MRELVQALLDSKGVLSKELDKSAEIEKDLMHLIGSKDEEIQSIKNYCSQKEREISNLEDELANIRIEAQRFKDEVERLFLKPDQQLVWNGDILEIYEN